MMKHVMSSGNFKPLSLGRWFIQQSDISKLLNFEVLFPCLDWNLTLQRKIKIFKTFLNIFEIQHLNVIFGLTTRNALKWVQTSLVLVHWFLK